MIGVGHPTQVVGVVHLVLCELCRTEAVDRVSHIFIGYHGNLHKQKKDNCVVVAKTVNVIVIVHCSQSLIHPNRSQDMIQSVKIGNR